MEDSLNICLACGLCCDGTLIGFVQLDPDEVPAIKEIKNIEFENGHGFFLQPCDKFCNGCTVYDKRPKRCASFKCKLLKSVEQKELEFDKAVETVHEVIEKKIVIEEKIAMLELELHSQSFYFKMVELKNRLHKEKSECTISEKQSELMADLEGLDGLLSKEFGVSLL